MKYQKHRTTLAVGLVTTLSILTLNPAQAADLAESNRLQNVAPEVFAESIMADDLRASLGGNLVATTSTGTVTLPRDTSESAVVSSSKATIKIKFPAPEKRAKATTASGGQIQFNNGDSSITNALPKDDGSLQIATTILSKKAPSRYRYELGLPAGARLTPTADGTIEIIASDGKTFLGGVGAAWAKDSAGQSISTRYEVEGQALIQVVDHSAKGTVYPVVADPWLGVELYYQPYISYHAQGYKVNVQPTTWATVNKGAHTLWAHRDEVKTKLGGNVGKWTNSIQEQFYCHIVGLPLSLPEFNMESWRPEMNYIAQAPYNCNYPEGGWGSVS